MASGKGALGFVGVGLVCLALAGCGGAGSSSTSGGSPATPMIAISISPASVSLAEGGASEAVQVNATAEGGFTGSISVSTSSLPSGVSVSPPRFPSHPAPPGLLCSRLPKTADWCNRQ
jgi:hypothetical protein